MDWLNYHHLLYFWTVAKVGSVTAAARQLHLAQSTISSQIQKLEKTMGSKLLQRRGRSVELTESGRLVYQYADEIFAIGRELSDVVQGRMGADTFRLRVGLLDVLPKLVVFELLRPALNCSQEVQLTCYEGKLDSLLTDLGMHRLDVVLADAPLSPTTHVQAFNHLLGECGMTVFGTAELARRYCKGFPKSLHQAPMLLPTQNTAMRRLLEQWFDDQQVSVQVKHEFEDSAVSKVFGQYGQGLFVAPTAIEQEVCRQYRVEVIGQIPEVKERFYAISAERRLKHPAVVAISKSARTELFGASHSPA